MDKVDKQPVVVFAPAQRAELLNLYAGFAMQVQQLTKNDGWVPSECVASAEALVQALEAHHTAVLARMGSGDPEAGGDDVQH